MKGIWGVDVGGSFATIGDAPLHYFLHNGVVHICGEGAALCNAEIEPPVIRTVGEIIGLHPVCLHCRKAASNQILLSQIGSLWPSDE